MIRETAKLRHIYCIDFFFMSIEYGEVILFILCMRSISIIFVCMMVLCVPVSGQEKTEAPRVPEIFYSTTSDWFGIDTFFLDIPGKSFAKETLESKKYIYKK